MLSEPESTRAGGAAGTGRRDARLILAAYVLLSVAGLVGLMIGSVPFGVDYPNHAARLFIECNLNDPHLSRMYSVEYGIIPNLAIDLINQPLCGLVDAMTVIRGTLIFTMAGILLVTWKIHRSLAGEPNAFILLAPAMTFNVITSMGYLNYLIGTFLFLAFAWSILRYRVLDGHPALAILLPNLFGILLFFCHVFALGLAVVFLFGLRFAKGQGQPWISRTVSAGLMTGGGFVLPLLLMLAADRSGFGLTYAAVGKLRTLLAPMIYSDIYAAAFIAFIWLALFYWAVRENKVSIEPQLRWPLVLLTAFSFALPSTLLHATDLDSRSLVSVAYLAIASIQFKGAARQNDAHFAAAATAAVTLALQLVSAIPQMLHFNGQVAEYRSALRVIEPARPVVSILRSEHTPFVPRRFYVHLTSYATLDRRAFNPSEFTGKGMQPMRAKPAYGCIDVPAGAPLRLNIARRLLQPETAKTLQRRRYTNLRYFYRWDRRFDYVIYYHHGVPSNPFPDLLRPVHQGTFFTIFGMLKPSTPNRPCA